MPGQIQEHRVAALPRPPTFVDDWSLACLTTDDNEEYGWRAGQVVRWHLDAIDRQYQGALVDTDIDAFLPSLIEELGPLGEGLRWPDGAIAEH